MLPPIPECPPTTIYFHIKKITEKLCIPDRAMSKEELIEFNKDENKKDIFKLENAFKDFMSKSFNYRKIYCQQNYNYGFDGYSYLGMEESTNQYAADLLHSFVLSEFHTIHSFPKEFYSELIWDSGIGITIDTPLGPARLDYAIQLNDFSKQKLQLGVQNLF